MASEAASQMTTSNAPAAQLDPEKLTLLAPLIRALPKQPELLRECLETPSQLVPFAVMEVSYMLNAGFMSRGQLIAEVGEDYVLNRLSCIVKQKASGDWKVRLITDLLRSGGNMYCAICFDATMGPMNIFATNLTALPRLPHLPSQEFTSA